MLITIRTLGVLGLVATLTACGATPAERATTGALAGGAVSAVTGESVLNGALIGGAVGGIAPCVINPGTAGCY